VGIVYTAEDQGKVDVINEFAERLRSLGIAVETLEYQPAKKTLHFSSLPSFSQKEIGFWGNINSTLAHDFITTRFDYLFLADREPGPVIRHILARSAANCRAGRNSAGVTPYLDLMVEINGSWHELLETLLSYVRKLS